MFRSANDAAQPARMARMTLQLIDNPPPWPNGARCAVCFSFDFDAESLLHLYYPDAPQGRIGMASALRYGASIAVPRIAKIWKHFGLRQTMFVPGWCVEQYPAAIEALLEGGHEIAHHGWLHERVNQLTPAQEEAVLVAGIEAIRAATGAAPAGYRCPSGAFSAHTLDLLVKHGLGYDASLHGDDVPFLLDGADGSVVELPSDLSLDDWPQYVHMKEFNMGMPTRAPARAMEVFRAEFDAAHAHGGLWAAIWHPFVSGRLARAEAMVGLIEHMQAKGGVWFATMAEIAAHVRGLVESGAWTPRRERLPYWTEPVPQIAVPGR